MVTRIKDLATGTPDGTEFGVFDSASGGTRKATLAAIVKLAGASNVHASESEPTVDDDESAGYVVGSLWVVASPLALWICRDNAEGAADWLELSAGASVDFAAVNAALATADADIGVNDQKIVAVSEIRSTASLTLRAGVSGTEDLFSFGSWEHDGRLGIGAALSVGAEVDFQGTLSPTALSGDVDNYAPTGHGTVFALRIDPGAASRTITGLAGGQIGRLVIVHNIGSYNLLLAGESGSSTAANRFATSYVLGTGDAVLLWYDSTSSRWRGLGHTPGGVTAAMAAMVNDAAFAVEVEGLDATSNVGLATLGQVTQPVARNVSGSTDTVVAGDIGNVITCSRNGGTEFDLPTLAASLISGRALVLTFQGTHASNAITINPNTGVTIDGSTSNFVGATGRTRISLISIDGLAWFSGA